MGDEDYFILTIVFDLEKKRMFGCLGINKWLLLKIGVIRELVKFGVDFRS